MPRATSIPLRAAVLLIVLAVGSLTPACAEKPTEFALRIVVSPALALGPITEPVSLVIDLEADAEVTLTGTMPEGFGLVLAKVPVTAKPAGRGVAVRYVARVSATTTERGVREAVFSVRDARGTERRRFEISVAVRDGQVIASREKAATVSAWLERLAIPR